MAQKGKKAEYEEAGKALGMKISAFMQYCADKEIERLKSEKHI